MPTTEESLRIDDIREAARRIHGVAHRTPVLTSRTLDEMCGARVFLKAECFQRVGAFKFRGAYNALSLLDADQRAKGVVAASSGNHAQAVALAGRLLGVPVTVVMPNDAPASKRAATLGYGAEVVQFDRYTQDRDAIQSEVAARLGRTIVPAYDSYRIMAGAGTTALELLEEVPDLDAFISPVSGGGLVAGCATAIKAISPGTRVYGAEPEAADDTKRSIAAGTRVGDGVPQTIADGLQAPIPGKLTFEINLRLLEGVLVASDQEIVEAMRFLLTRQKVLVEPSGAVGLAALIRNNQAFRGARVGVVLSGGNVDWEKLRSLFG